MSLPVLRQNTDIRGDSGMGCTCAGSGSASSAARLSTSATSIKLGPPACGERSLPATLAGLPKDPSGSGTDDRHCGPPGCSPCRGGCAGTGVPHTLS